MRAAAFEIIGIAGVEDAALVVDGDLEPARDHDTTFLAIVREQCYNAGFFNHGEGFVRGHWFYDWWDADGNGPTEEFFYPQYDCGDVWE